MRVLMDFWRLVNCGTSILENGKVPGWVTLGFIACLRFDSVRALLVQSVF